RRPEGRVPGDVALARGRTITALIASHAASEDKKSRLYCAIPPCPPNASVTSAKTRIGDLTSGLSPRSSLKGITLLRNSLFFHGQNVQRRRAARIKMIKKQSKWVCEKKKWESWQVAQAIANRANGEIKKT